MRPHDHVFISLTSCKECTKRLETLVRQHPEIAVWIYGPRKFVLLRSSFGITDHVWNKKISRFDLKFSRQWIWIYDAVQSGINFPVLQGIIATCSTLKMELQLSQNHNSISTRLHGVTAKTTIFFKISLINSSFAGLRSVFLKTWLDTKWTKKNITTNLRESWI
jgi:hypothetical protein